MYHEDATVNDIILTVINDGNGSQCKGTYEDRCAAARENDLFKFRYWAREYGRYRHRVYGSSVPTREQALIAGNMLFEYYKEHLKECDEV